MMHFAATATATARKEEDLVQTKHFFGAGELDRVSGLLPVRRADRSSTKQQSGETSDYVFISTIVVVEETEPPHQSQAQERPGQLLRRRHPTAKQKNRCPQQETSWEKKPTCTKMA
jgi:hypothetical protein